MSTAFSCRVFCSTTVLLFLGCGDPVSTPEPRLQKPSPAPSRKPPTQVSAPAPNQESQLRFAQRVKDAVDSRDPLALNRCIDWQGIVDAAVESFPLEESDKAGFKKGLLSSIRGREGFAGQVTQDLGDEGSYSFLRLHERDGHPYALFRLVSDGGMNYHDYKLVSRAGEATAGDIYLYVSGEHLSTTLRRGLLPAVRQISKNWLQKIGSSDKAVVEEYEKLTAMQQKIAQGDARGALLLFESMSEELQANKVVQILRYQAAAAIDEGELVKAYDEFERRFPGDDALLLLSIDALLARGENDRVVEAIDLLNKSVGGDALLLKMKVGLFLEQEQPELAVLHAKEFVEQCPRMQDAAKLLVGVLLMQQDYAALAVELDRQEKEFEIEWDDPRSDPSFAGFAASPEGRQWMERHGFESPAQAGNGGTDGKPGSTEPGDPPRAAQGFLTWSDSSGKFSVEAQFVGLADGAITLKKKDGREVVVPLERLSPDSQLQASKCKGQQLIDQGY